MAGRPPKTDSERRDKPLRIRLSQDERARIERAAQAMGVGASTWARIKLLELAAHEAPPPPVEQPKRRGRIDR